MGTDRIDSGKNRKKKAITDSSSVILFARSGLLPDVCSFYELIISPEVKRETTHEGYPGSREIVHLINNKKISVVDPLRQKKYPEESEDKLKRLGSGERETIILYITGVGDFIVVDDREAALYCVRQEIPYINSLLVPVIMNYAGIFEKKEKEKFFKALLACGRFSDAIIEYASDCPAENLAYFL